MKIYTHIIFKNTSSLDFILPYYLREFKKKKLKKLILFVWELDDNKIRDNLIRINKIFKIPIKIYYLKKFIKEKSIKFLIKNNIRFNKIFINKIYDKVLVFNFINNILFKSDKVFLDNKEFKQIYFYKNLFHQLKKSNKEILLVPHAPHYRFLGQEIDKNSLNFLNNEKIKFNLICSNKLNFKLLEKKYNCSYLKLPCYNNVTKILKKNSNKNVGLILRPFIKNFSNKQLKNHDYYISSFEDNAKFINIAKKLYTNGYKIFFRLHPSSDTRLFKIFYGNKLKGFKYKIFNGSIFEFFMICRNIVSFHSTSIIYALNFNCKIYLFKNKLSKKIYKNWPTLEKLYKSISVEFFNINEIYFDNKEFKEKQIKKNKILQKFW